MTFFEAAVEILRESGRALHYKKITELAIERSLLSHVGRTPQVTMEARLSQEADKEEGAKVRRIRPGVFVLCGGLTESAFHETESGEPASSTPESAAVAPDVGLEGGAAPRRRRRRPPRVSGPLREGSAVPPGAETTPPSPRPRYPTLADAVTEALSAVERPVTAGELAERLSQEPSDPVSPLVVEQSIRGANRRRQRAGRRPLFTRLDQGWVLTQRELSADAIDLYDRLERVHGRLVEGAVASLVRALRQLRGRDLDAFARATLDGLGYDVTPLERTDQAVVVAARMSEGLVPIRAAVSVWHDEALTGNAVAALRGRLPRYGATHGVMVAVRRGVIDASARAEAAASGDALPVALYDAETFAPLALHARVGVVQHELNVPLLDATWFQLTEAG